MNLHLYTASRLAAMLGVDLAEIERLHASDPRILAEPALDTSHAVRRLRRWLCGRPDGDVARLAYRGSARVRGLLVEVLRALPAPARYLATVHTTWREIGFGARGRAGASLPRRAFDVELAGGAPDEIVRGVACHELGHIVNHPLDENEQLAPEFDGPRLDAEDVLAAHVLVARQNGATEGQLAYERAVWIGQHVAEELRADRQAAAWGFPHRGPNEDDLRRMFAAEYDEARRLAALAEEAA